MTIANNNGLIGAANDVSTSTAKFALGTIMLAAGTDYLYCQATGGAIAAGGQFAPTGAFGTGAGTTYTHDVLAPGVALNEYFWAKRIASSL